MKYAFVNGVLLDGTENMTPQRGLAVLTDGDRITDISRRTVIFPAMKRSIWRADT